MLRPNPENPKRDPLAAALRNLKAAADCLRIYQAETGTTFDGTAEYLDTIAKVISEAIRGRDG